MRYFVLLGLIACGVVGICYLIGSFLDRRRNKLAMLDALQRAVKKRDRIWKEVESVGDVVALYMRMVVKHGPDSDEAKAFRFGTDSKLIRELHNSEARAAFEQQADIIDKTARALEIRKCN